QQSSSDNSQNAPIISGFSGGTPETRAPVTFMPDLAFWQWAVGGFCAFMVGVAKTGVPGLGIFVIPVMVLTVGDAKQSAGWLLPILCMADLFAVIAWRGRTAAFRLFALAPWVALGMAGGAAALSLHERVLRPMVGAIILAMLATFLWRRHRSA